ncbi:Nucleoside-diphosphate-sugar epimerase [Entamoeba marina]
MQNRRTVLLTGATGVMGYQGLQELLKVPSLSIRVLVRDTKQDRAKLKPYLKKIEVIYGDLTNYESVLRSVQNVDYILHVGGLVSPAADPYPTRTLHVNITASENIVRAVRETNQLDTVKIVYIGSIAEVGDRQVPYHYSRCGDPLNPSVYDHYAMSKIEAERIIVESGIKNWVSLRQTGILYPELILKGADPISFHVPIDEVIEWATREDSGSLLAKVCDENVPQEFWNNFYHISSGKTYRMSNYEFMTKLLNVLGCPPAEEVFERNWFATRNFHGSYFSDGEVLENYLHFRKNVSCDDYFLWLKKQVPWYFTFAKWAPGFVIKKFMASYANVDMMGTMDWIANGNDKRVSSYFKSREDWNQIGDWSSYHHEKAPEDEILFDHGYDEQKGFDKLNLTDIKNAAEFRGGECLSDHMVEGDLATKLLFKCSFGHEFELSPALMLKGGHWCKECHFMKWNGDEIAKVNRFFAQAWYVSHDKNEDNYYDETIFDGWENEANTNNNSN